MTQYLSNAFSLGMLPRNVQSGYQPFVPSPAKQPTIDDVANFVSIVGHENTAKMLSALLGAEVAFNRQTVTLAPGDGLLVAQYVGPRLPEGATELPIGARVEWWYLRQLTLAS